MTKQELYLALYQATVTAEATPAITAVDDFDRHLEVHTSYCHNGELSHVTLEFHGIRSRFLCSLVFDGTGSHGTGFSSFTMPKVKLNPRQRSIAILACLEFLIFNDFINANYSYFAERITVEHQTGRAGFIEHYNKVRQVSIEYIHDHPELRRYTHELTKHSKTRIL